MELLVDSGRRQRDTWRAGALANFQQNPGQRSSTDEVLMQDMMPANVMNSYSMFDETRAKPLRPAMMDGRPPSCMERI
jgi:hypothetical protein